MCRICFVHKRPSYNVPVLLSSTVSRIAIPSVRGSGARTDVPQRLHAILARAETLD